MDQHDGRTWVTLSLISFIKKVSIHISIITLVVTIITLVTRIFEISYFIINSFFLNYRNIKRASAILYFRLLAKTDVP